MGFLRGGRILPEPRALCLCNSILLTTQPALRFQENPIEPRGTREHEEDEGSWTGKKREKCHLRCQDTYDTMTMIDLDYGAAIAIAAVARAATQKPPTPEMARYPR
jgi:hypothetical protein